MFLKEVSVTLNKNGPSLIDNYSGSSAGQMSNTSATAMETNLCIITECNVLKYNLDLK